MTQGLNNINTPNRPQRQQPVIRIQGVDTPNPSFGQNLQSGQEVNLPDITDQKFQEIEQAQAETFEAVSQANQAQAQADIADLQAQGFSDEGVKLGDLASQVVNTVKIIEERKLKEEQAEAKLAEQRRKKRRAQLKNTARSKLQDAFTQFQREARASGLQKGVETFRREGNQILQRFRGELSPNQFEELQESFNSTLNQAQEDLTSRQLEDIRQTRDRFQEIEKNKILTRLEPQFAKLEQTTDPEEANNIIKKIRQEAKQLAPSRKDQPQQFANIYLSALEETRNAADTSATAIAKINQEIEQTRNYVNDAKTLIEQYNNGEINGDALRVGLLQRANAHDVPELAGKDLLSTNQERRQEEIRRLEQQEKLRRLQESDESAINREMLKKVQDAEIGRLAHGFNRDTTTKMLVNQICSGDRFKGFCDTIKQTSKTMEQDRQEFLNLRQQALKKLEDVTETKIENKEIFFDDFIPELQYDSESNTLKLPRKTERVQQIAERTGQSVETVKRRINNLLKQKEAVFRRMESLQSKWDEMGVNINNLDDTSGLASQEEAIKPILEQVDREPEPSPGSRRQRGRNLPNPRSGATGTPDTPTVAPLAKSDDGVFVRPFHKKDADKVTVTSGYGNRDDPNGPGQELHNGVDYAVPEGTDARTVQGGKVLFVTGLSGFGQTVAVKTPDGRTELFAHLKDANVQPGQEIPPGETIGEVGASGNASGPVLHFQVFKGDPQLGGRHQQHAATMNPANYLKQVRQQHSEPRGQGPPPNQKVPGADGVVDSGTNRSRPVKEQHNQANPARTKGRVPYRKTQYPSRTELNANHGYEALRNDPDFARKLNQVANDMNIPGQWLADLIAHETAGSFRADQPEAPGGANGMGLIQFTPQTARNLGTSRAELKQMSRVEQMEFVKKYLEPFKGQIDTMHDLVAAVWGGRPLFRRSFEERMNDYKNYSRYLDQVGRHAGREYKLPTDRNLQSSQRIHTKPVAGCSQCNQMLRKENMFVEHYAG